MADNKQLIERLRSLEPQLDKRGFPTLQSGWLTEAADAIERLEAERDHWKAGHDEQVRRKRATRERLLAVEAKREQVGESDGD